MRIKHPPLALLTLVVGFVSGDYGPLRAADAEPASTNQTTWVKLAGTLMQKSSEGIDDSVCERVRSACSDALAEDPGNVDALIGLAWVHNTRQEFDQGKAWAEKALALNPKLPSAHALLGDAALGIGDYDAALAHYQKALDIRPDLTSYSRAAHGCWLTGNVRKARWLMEKAIKAGEQAGENTASCRADLALMLWHDGAILPADQQAEAALKQAPDDPHVLAILGKIKTAKKEYAKAIGLYERALQTSLAHDALVALGDLYFLTGRPDEAERQYQRVIALHTAGGVRDPAVGARNGAIKQGDAQLARFYADHDRNLDDALREAEMAYRKFKTVAVTDTLAWCYYKKGLYVPARNMIVKALRLKTPDATILFHAGMIYEKLGDRGAAKIYLYRALSLNPLFDPLNASVAANTLRSLSGNSAQTKATTAERRND